MKRPVDGRAGILAVLFLGCLLRPVPAAEPAPAAATAANPAPGADRILQQELKQQQIKTTTQRVGDQLAAIIAEFERNAIDGEDVKVLKAIRSVLGRLTEEDMQKVIGFLQQARAAGDAPDATRRATDAYAGQKTIVTQLKQLVLEYQRQQALYELSLRFKEFANRQTANMWLGVALAKETDGKPLGSFNETQQSSLRVQQIDQENLREEILMTLGKLGQLGQEINDDGPTAERAKLALKQADDGGLKPALESTVEELKTGKMLSAAGNEKRARDQLREISRLLLLSQGELEALRQALRELEQAIDQQKAVLDDTRKVDKDDTSKVKPRQIELGDTTDLIRRDVNDLAPVAADHLKDAFNKMQEARGTLEAEKDFRKQREKAPPQQEDALANLEQARRALQEQLAKAEELDTEPDNALAALQQLQEQVRELIKQEEQLKETAAAAPKKDLAAQAPKQGELKDTAQELQQKASPRSPAAAQSINEAAGQMQKSQSSLASAQNNPAAQQAAIDALQRADQQLGEDIERLQKAQEELAQAEELLRRLEAIIEEQQRVQFSTAKEAAKKEVAPAPALAENQQKLGADTAQLQQDASAPVPTAATYLGSAKGHMDTAKAELDKPAPPVAQAKQTDALNDLYAAKREFEKKIDELRETLGMPPADSQQSLADAMALIEQAQRDVDQAMQQMQQGPPGLMDMLLEQQRQIANSLGELAKTAPNSPPVSQAQKSADHAAQRLARSDLAKAVEAMKAAEGAMQQAMKSGNSGQPGQSGQSGKPGQGQPQAQGQGEGTPSVPQISKQQSEVREAAESMLQALQSAPAQALQQAAQSLENAGTKIGPLTAGRMGPMPRAAQRALQQAQGSLASGAAQASAGQGPPAQAEASSAAQALAQAQAALALAQAGMGSDSMMAGQGQGQGQTPGQGQSPSRSQGQGQGNPGPQGTGRQGNWTGSGGADGARRNALGPGQYTGLPKRDRAAIIQSQSEKYPQEYGPLVEQYLKNLSDQTGGR